MIWHCPRCGTELQDEGRDLRCPAEDEIIPAAELGASDGLNTGTTYHYRAVAMGDNGVPAYGDDMTFVAP